ncbi:MAG: PHP domain-containing protein [Candidatus Omnitrophica bacterium]|nr:PHP domain-containing protein [Candidatus Omnitrophota bacterium]MBU1128598.1 PHP domain-containing protein [Candidatus Omnitrophota bacterium]MBU1784725.1 PHP domain-containing protein [Candidatus Omnitrophota bacterium]MBU1851552.1 PHP domain-containing protein [Candidatus Omnitrophota bacterium]
MMDRDMTIFRRFNEVDERYLSSDKHIHTCFVDGEGTVRNIVKEASVRGLNQIAITDHMRKDSTYSAGYFDEIEKQASLSDIQVLKGFEAKIKDFDGNIDISDDVLSRAEVGIASVHRFPMGNRLCFPEEFDKKICQEIELELTLNAVKKGICNVIGHPGGMSIRAYGEFPSEFFEEIIDACSKSNIAFDINSAYHVNAAKQVAGILKRYDPFVSFGSDAHSLDRIGECLQDVWRECTNV